MFENKDTPKTPLSDYGEFALIEHLTKSFKLENESSIIGIGDDSAVIGYKSKLLEFYSDMINNIETDEFWVDLNKNNWYKKKAYYG